MNSFFIGIQVSNLVQEASNNIKSVTTVAPGVVHARLILEVNKTTHIV